MSRHPDEVVKACCTPSNPRGPQEAASYDPLQPQVRIPRKVIKGGSHLCAPNYCRRYRPAERFPEPIDTSTCHLVDAGASVIGPRGFALVMITLGVVMLVVATVQHRRDMRALRDQYGLLVPQSLATYSAILIAALGVLLLLAALFRQ